MTAWLRLPIFVAGLVPALFLAGFLGQSVVRAAALVPDAKGQKPQVKSKMVYGREKVSYDLEKQANFRSAGRPLGWYYTTDEVGHRMQIQGGCLKSLNNTVKVFPVIQLRGIYKKKRKNAPAKASSNTNAATAPSPSGNSRN